MMDNIIISWRHYSYSVE